MDFVVAGMGVAAVLVVLGTIALTRELRGTLRQRREEAVRDDTRRVDAPVETSREVAAAKAGGVTAWTRIGGGGA